MNCLYSPSWAHRLKAVLKFVTQQNCDIRRVTVSPARRKTFARWESKLSNMTMALRWPDRSVCEVRASILLVTIELRWHFPSPHWSLMDHVKSQGQIVLISHFRSSLSCCVVLSRLEM